jgi:hypothetical protein
MNRLVDDSGYNNLTLGKILQIENDEVLQGTFCADGLLVWPLIRSIFFRLIMSDFLYPSQPLLEITRKPPIFSTARKIFRSLAHNLMISPTKNKVLIFATGSGVISQGEHSFNKYTGYFSDELFGSSWSIEGIPWEDWPLPRSDGKLSFWFHQNAYHKIMGRLMVNSSHHSISRRIISIACKRAREILNWEIGEKRLEWLILKFAQIISAIPWQIQSLRKIFSTIRPRLCLVEEGCYGGMAVFNFVAKQLGIFVAEFQHGAVASGHDVYNFCHSFLSNPNLKMVLPDCFLSYGSWWEQQINVPIKKIVIGNPHRTATLKTLPKIEGVKNVILVLGEGRETRRYLEVCHSLAGEVGGRYKVIFRPHPEERDFLIKMPLEGRFSNFKIDFERDIYKSLVLADIVVSELSTASFESVGLANRTFIWRTPKSIFNMPISPFDELNSISDLPGAIEKPSSGKLTSLGQDAIWANNWQENFRKFLTNVL